MTQLEAPVLILVIAATVTSVRRIQQAQLTAEIAYHRPWKLTTRGGAHAPG